MELVLNIALLATGTIGAFAAIGGDTWRKAPEAKWTARVTRRGWLAIVCLCASALLGVFKEVRAADAAERGRIRERELQASLNKSEARELMLQQEIERTKHLIRVAANGTQRVVDQPHFTASGAEVQPVISDKPPRNQLQVRPADTIEYHAYPIEALDPSGGPAPTLRIGRNDYPIRPNPDGTGRITVVGIGGRPMVVEVRNRAGRRFNLKLLVKSFYSDELDELFEIVFNRDESSGRQPDGEPVRRKRP